MRRPTVLAGLLLALPTAAALAADGPDAEQCDAGGFVPLLSAAPTQGAIGLARVVGGVPLHLRCGGGQSNCRSRTYVAPGSQVLTRGAQRGEGHLCVFHPDAWGGVAGWVSRDRLAPVLPAAAPPLQAWAGTWTKRVPQGEASTSDGRSVLYGERLDDTIKLTPGGDGLAVEGLAHARTPGIAVHEGDLAGTARPQGNKVVFTSGSDPAREPCTVTMALVGPWLVVADNYRPALNGSCAGYNVTFSGVYRRR